MQQTEFCDVNDIAALFILLPTYQFTLPAKDTFYSGFKCQELAAGEGCEGIYSIEYMNFTCINPSACTGGVIKVFDRTYTNSDTGSFFRCADHACSTGAAYSVTKLDLTSVEWTCYDPVLTT